LSLQPVLTHRCSLECPHCYVVPPRGPEDLLSLEEYDRCFEEWAALGVLRLSLTGGEPALRPELVDIVAAAGRRHFLIHLKTSGTRTSPEDIERLFDVGLSVLEVSLYAATPDKHDAFVGEPGAFSKTTRAAETFKAAGGRVRINIMAMRWNAADVPRLLNGCLQKGFDYTVDPVVVVRQDGNREPLRFRMTEAQLTELMRNPGINDSAQLLKLPEKKKDAPICGAGQGSAQIEPNGDVLLCDKLRQPLGNIRRQSLKDIWEGSVIRKKFLGMRWGDLTQCAECKDARACSHCPGAALAEIGDIAAALPYACLVTRAMMRRTDGKAADF
jgi:PqqA peptide cyclase